MVNAHLDSRSFSPERKAHWSFGQQEWWVVSSEGLEQRGTGGARTYLEPGKGKPRRARVPRQAPETLLLVRLVWLCTTRKVVQSLARGLEGDAVRDVQEFVSDQRQHVRRKVLEAKVGHDQRFRKSGRNHPLASGLSSSTPEGDKDHEIFDSISRFEIECIRRGNVSRIPFPFPKKGRNFHGA